MCNPDDSQNSIEQNPVNKIPFVFVLVFSSFLMTLLRVPIGMKVYLGNCDWLLVSTTGGNSVALMRVSSVKLSGSASQRWIYISLWLIFTSCVHIIDNI